MLINGNTLISEIQEEFHNQFQGLQIKFYNKEHEALSGSKSNEEIISSKKIKELNPNMESAVIDFDKNMSVMNFEKMMENDFKLHVQVFRRSNQHWLQTTSTDVWTLDVQNTKGLHSIQE